MQKDGKKLPVIVKKVRGAAGGRAGDSGAWRPAVQGGGGGCRGGGPWGRAPGSGVRAGPAPLATHPAARPFPRRPSSLARRRCG
jgi:hypothetical protein